MNAITALLSYKTRSYTVVLPSFFISERFQFTPPSVEIQQPNRISLFHCSRSRFNNRLYSPRCTHKAYNKLTTQKPTIPQNTTQRTLAHITVSISEITTEKPVKAQTTNRPPAIIHMHFTIRTIIPRDTHMDHNMFTTRTQHRFYPPAFPFNT